MKKINLPLSEDKKLKVLFRLEPGCLGANGVEYIDAFCHFAEQEVQSVDADFILWSIIPRHDKQLPEVEYSINQKKLSHQQAEKYLALFDKVLDEFEEHLNDKLTQLIEHYFQR